MVLTQPKGPTDLRTAPLPAHNYVGEYQGLAGRAGPVGTHRAWQLPYKWDKTARKGLAHPPDPSAGRPRPHSAPECCLCCLGRASSPVVTRCAI
jgi:hypothetical protein